MHHWLKLCVLYCHLKKDGVGGQPDVAITTTSDSIRSVLELDITLLWSFEEVKQLQIDLASILEEVDLPEDVATFAKGIVGLNGQALADLKGSLSFTLGIGLEYVKATKAILPFIKGTTQVAVGLEINAGKFMPFAQTFIM